MQIIDVCAIVVTYHPDDKLYALLQTLLEQTGAVLIVDNTDSTAKNLLQNIECRLSASNNLHKIMLGHNVGIGAALNQGIVWAKNQGFHSVLLSDQDSCPDNKMVSELLTAQNNLTAAGHRIAVVGPVCIDGRSNRPMPFIQFIGCRQNRASHSMRDKNYQVVDFLITSGSLIDLKVVDQMGLFDESLFIDNVDIEWCLRAAKQGYVSVGVSSAKLVHHLGENEVNVMRRRVRTHSPARLYYRFRNGVLLYKCDYVPLCWKLRDAWLLCLKTMFYTVAAPNRMQSIRMILLGLWHGIRGIKGKYHGKTA